MNYPLIKLEELAETSSGGTPSRGNLKYYRGSIPWVKSGELPDGIIEKVEENISKEGLNNSSTKLLPEGTLLIAMYGATVGRLGILKFPAATNQAVCAIKPKNKLDRDFLFYYLLSIRSTLLEKSFGGAQPNISQDLIRNLLIPNPPIEVQANIASKLNSQLTEIEKAREAVELAIKDLKQLEYLVFEHFLSEFKNSKGLKIGEYAITGSGSTPSRGNKHYWESGEIPWIKTGEIAFKPITTAQEYVTQQALEECSIKLLPENAVLVAMYGQGKTRGQSAILKVPATINQACFAIYPNDTWHPEFLQLWLRYTYKDLRSMSDNRGGNQANLNGALLNSLEVPAPPINQQKELVVKISIALHEVTKMREGWGIKKAEINSLPNRLLAEAFNKTENGKN